MVDPLGIVLEGAVRINRFNCYARYYLPGHIVNITSIILSITPYIILTV